jgi:hypothetical protein
MTVGKYVAYVSSTGELHRLANGDTINAGGVSGPTFFVDGKPLIFADGTTTDGSGTSIVTSTLQGVYDNSNGVINLTLSKDFTINSLSNKLFKVDATSGKVTITGDFEVLGTSTVIDGTISNLDQININPPDGTTSALLIEPMVGVVMTNDLVRFRLSNGGQEVFKIDNFGLTTIHQLAVDTTINGVDIVADHNALTAHLANDVALKHTAKQISVQGPFSHISGNNVEEALASIDSSLGSTGASVKTFAYFEASGALTWNIAHNQGSVNAQVTIYDNLGEQVWPDSVEIVDSNNLTVFFKSLQAGRAIIFLF